MGELFIVTASSILDAGRGPVFKYPFDVSKKFRWQNVLKETKWYNFCLFYSYCRFNFCQCFANQLLEGAVVLM